MSVADELGKAVHGECYLLKLKLERESADGKTVARLASYSESAQKGISFVQDETEFTTQPLCPICKKPITPENQIVKGLESGRKAHLACYIDHMDDNVKKSSD